jgi:hypothetical protein
MRIAAQLERSTHEGVCLDSAAAGKAWILSQDRKVDHAASTCL